MKLWAVDATKPTRIYRVLGRRCYQTLCIYSVLGGGVTGDSAFRPHPSEVLMGRGRGYRWPPLDQYSAGEAWPDGAPEPSTVLVELRPPKETCYFRRNVGPRGVLGEGGSGGGERGTMKGRSLWTVSESTTCMLNLWPLRQPFCIPVFSARTSTWSRNGHRICLRG